MFIKEEYYNKDFFMSDDWKGLIKESFDRRMGVYNYATVTRVKIFNEDICYELPTKIIFESGYYRVPIKTKKECEFKIGEKDYSIREEITQHIFGFYERKEKLSGDIYEILEDLLGEAVYDWCLFSKTIQNTHSGLLYGIDRNIDWPAYVMVLQEKVNKTIPGEISKAIELRGYLSDFGISYKLEDYLNEVFVVFKMPYIKILENKLTKSEEQEYVRLVLEYKADGYFYQDSPNIEIEVKLYNRQKELIYDNIDKLVFNKSQYQVHEIYPDRKEEIIRSEFNLKINGVLVDWSSGVYLRGIKINTSIKR